MEVAGELLGKVRQAERGAIASAATDEVGELVELTRKGKLGRVGQQRSAAVALLLLGKGGCRLRRWRGEQAGQKTARTGIVRILLLRRIARKPLDGKHGERLIRRMTEKGISMQAIKVAPNRPVHFTGFFTLGADKPFIMVENLDTYDEIVKLLRGRKHAKLFGTKVGGVIFGGGCKASVSHALDDYLAEIGYRFNYVYYVGDIDREGARIVEQTRNANVVEIRLHAGMYRAMLAEHKRRVKAGGECEPAAANQGVPQNLAATIKDLPMVTRVQFRNVLREGGRIPQEILMTADYRDGDSGSFDRMLNN